MRSHVVLGVAMGLLLVGSRPGRAEVKINLSDAPQRGKKCSVQVTGISEQGIDPTKAKVQLTVRPNSLVEDTTDLGALDSEGKLTWTPTVTGVCTLAVLGPDTEGQKGTKKVASRSVAVRFGHVPPLGLLVFTVAGVALFGGMCWSAALLFRGRQAETGEA